jgi:hypothetical protein
MASTLLELGQLARARQVLQPAPDSVQLSTRARRLTVEARIDRALGSSALPRLRQALALLGAHGDPPARILAQLEMSREVDVAEALALCHSARVAAEAIEHAGAAMKARLLEIDAYLRAGDNDAARARVDDVQAAIGQCRPADMYWPEACWIICRALDATGDEPAALDELRRAAHWIEHTALPHVSPLFRDSFLHRNPVNRAVLTAALRRLGA